MGLIGPMQGAIPTQSGSFPEGISLMNKQVSRLAKSAVVLYVTVFRHILAKRVKH